MNSAAFVRKIRRLGRERGVTVSFDPVRGEGSHGTLYYGSRRTMVSRHSVDLPRSTLRSMLKQLGLTEEDLR